MIAERQLRETQPLRLLFRHCTRWGSHCNTSQPRSAELWYVGINCTGALEAPPGRDSKAPRPISPTQIADAGNKLPGCTLLGRKPSALGRHSCSVPCPLAPRTKSNYMIHTGTLRSSRVTGDEYFCSASIRSRLVLPALEAYTLSRSLPAAARAVAFQKCRTPRTSHVSL